MKDNIKKAKSRQPIYDEMEKQPIPNTWSAQMPAYAGTEIEAHPEGIQPVKTYKQCLLCRYKYPVDYPDRHCTCGGQLYHGGSYYQLRTGKEG